MANFTATDVKKLRDMTGAGMMDAKKALDEADGDFDAPSDIVEHERQIAEATSREEGKPEQAIAKITEGRLNGFFKDVVLLEQPSVTENKKTVKAVLDESGPNRQRVPRFEGGAPP